MDYGETSSDNRGQCSISSNPTASKDDTCTQSNEPALTPQQPRRAALEARDGI